MFIIFMIMFFWWATFIGAMVFADKGNKKGFYYCFGGCFVIIGILFIVSVWMLS